MEEKSGLDASLGAGHFGVAQAPVPQVGEAPTPGSTHQNDDELSVWGFQGRINRGEFWARMAVLILGTLAIGVIVSMLAYLVPGTRTGNADGVLEAGFLLVGLPYLFFAFWFSLATQVKRWHDVDKSGWMVLLNLIPYLGIIVVIVLGCLPGTEGNNRYGINPLSSGSQPQDAGPSIPSSRG